MLRSLIAFIIFIASFTGFSQDQDLASFISEGYEHYINQDYEKAIEAYKKALTIDPTLSIANNQVALSYFKLGDWDTAITYSDHVIRDNNDQNLVLSAYVTKGSALDILGQTDASITLFKKAISVFPESNYLHFNLAVNYFKIQEYTQAEKHAIESAMIAPDHFSSHFLLAHINNSQGEKAQTLLASYYFLLVEPHTKKSIEALDMIYNTFSNGVTEDETKEGEPKNINITYNPSNNAEFQAAELMIPLLQASQSTKENEGKSENELFQSMTTSFFSILEEPKEENKGIWWEFYVPFLKKLATSDHMETFCHYIQQSKNEESIAWLGKNEEKINAMFTWFNN